MCEVANWLRSMADLGTLIGGLGTAGGLVYVARQIQLTRADQWRNEQWRRTELARGLIDRLSSDDELVFCSKALEWGVGPLIIPEKYEVLFDPRQKTFEHSPNTMSAAVRVALAPKWRAPEALVYRYCFDTFFSYLELISHQISAGHLRKEQVVGLEYYLQLIRNPPYLKRKEVVVSGGRPFKPFVDRYYPGLSDFIWGKNL